MLWKSRSKYCEDAGRASSNKKRILKHGAKTTLEMARQKRVVSVSQVCVFYVTQIVNAIFNDTEAAPRLDLVADKQFELGNIQRRIYDVVNVLVALGYIQKLPNKMIAYKGQGLYQPTEPKEEPASPHDLLQPFDSKRRTLEAITNYVPTLYHIVRPLQCGCS